MTQIFVCNSSDFIRRYEKQKEAEGKEGKRESKKQTKVREIQWGDGQIRNWERSHKGRERERYIIWPYYNSATSININIIIHFFDIKPWFLRFQIDESEMALISCICLFIDRTEFRDQLEDPEGIEALCLKYTMLLQSYQNTREPKRPHQFPRCIESYVLSWRWVYTQA